MEKDRLAGMQPSLLVGPTRGTSLPGNEDPGNQEGRYGTTTEKARALPDTLASSR